MTNFVPTASKLSERWSQEICEKIIEHRRAGKKVSEISELLGVPPSTISLILHRAKNLGARVTKEDTATNIIATQAEAPAPVAAPAVDIEHPRTVFGKDVQTLTIVLSHAQIGLYVVSGSNQIGHCGHLVIARIMEHINRSIQWAGTRPIARVKLMITGGLVAEGANHHAAQVALAAIKTAVQEIRKQLPHSHVILQYVYAKPESVKPRYPLQRLLDDITMVACGTEAETSIVQHLCRNASGFGLSFVAYGNLVRGQSKTLRHPVYTFGVDGQRLTRMKTVANVQRWIGTQINGLDPHSQFVISGLSPDIQITPNVILPGSLSGEYGDGRVGAPIQQVAFVTRRNGTRDTLINDLTFVDTLPGPAHPMSRVDIVRRDVYARAPSL